MLACFRELARWSKTGKQPQAETLSFLTACATERSRDASPAIPPELFFNLDEILRGDHAGRVIEKAWRILALPLPVLGEMAHCPQNTPFHVWNVLGHTARVVDASPSTSLSRWAALFHDCGKPSCRRVDAAGRDHFKGHDMAGADIADSSLRGIGAPDKLRSAVCLLVRMHESYTAADAASCEKTLHALGGDIRLYFALTSLQIADASAKRPGVTERRNAALEMRAFLRAAKAQGQR